MVVVVAVDVAVVVITGLVNPPIMTPIEARPRIEKNIINEIAAAFDSTIIKCYNQATTQLILLIFLKIIILLCKIDYVAILVTTLTGLLIKKFIIACMK